MDALANLFGDDKKSKKKSSRPVVVTKLNFNPTKFPSGTVLSFSLLLLIIAGGLFFVSNLIPQIGNSSIRESVLESTRNFELDDEINGGLFSQSNRKGDTSHNIQSTFMGISILNGNIKNVKGAKDFLQKLQLSNFEENLEYINYGVRLLKVLGLLDANEYSSKALVDRLYNQILGHQEQGVGFRITKFSSPTIAASFYALDALGVLGKLEEFKKTSEFSNVVQYVLSQKVNGGFIEREGENATLSATYFATRALLFDSGNQDTLREMGDIASFIYERQALNGAFLEDAEEYDINALNSYTSLQALFSLYSLVEAGVEDGGVFSEFSSSASKGSGYIRSVLRGGRGVRSSLHLSTIHLPSNYLFIQLIDTFPHFNYGTIPEIKNILLGVAVLLALYALFQFYREQIEDKKTLNVIFLSLRNILILLSVSLVTFYFLPSLSILFYLFTFTFIGTKFFSALQSETNTNVSDFLSAPLLTAFIHLLLLILLNSSTNGNCFTTFYYYYIFAVWSAVSAFLSTYIFSNLMQNRKPQFYLASAFIGWVFSVMTTILYLTGSEAWRVSLQLIQINGQFPLLLVVLPFISLSLSYPAALLPLVF